MPNRMSAIDDVKLIQEIKKYPQIYDRRHNDYKNTQQRNELWDMIAEKTNCDSEFCQNRWVTLRVQFRREHKKLQSNPNVRKVWKHYDALKFLINHFREEANRKIVFTKENEAPLRLNMSDIHVQPTNQILTESPVSFHPSEFLSSTPLTYANATHPSLTNDDMNGQSNHHHHQHQHHQLPNDVNMMNIDGHHQHQNHEHMNPTNSNGLKQNNTMKQQQLCQQSKQSQPILGDILENVNTLKTRIDRIIHNNTFNRQMKLAALSDLITHLGKHLQYVVEQ